MNLKTSFVVLIIGSSLIILSPFLVFLIKHTDLNSTGQIGDTIGGITAPIANIVGSILVFLALKAQIEANKIIQDQFQTQQKEESLQKMQQFFLDQFKIIREDIVSFAFIDQRGGSLNLKVDDTKFVEVRGASAFQKTMEAILELGNKENTIKSPLFKEFNTILVAINQLITQIESSALNDGEKLNIKTLIEYTVRAKISPAFDYYDSCIRENPDYMISVPETFISVYKSIMDELTKHLLWTKNEA